ncbi:MAG: nucleotidyltransferase domain-containing protein [bacterium]
MKFTNPLNDILGNKSNINTLRFLIRNNVEQSGREIARSTKLAQRRAHQVLTTLWQNGIVKMRRAGRSKLYKINPENALVKEALMPLFTVESRLLKNLGKQLHSKIGQDALSIIIFGSIASGQERANSDIDVLIIAKNTANIGKIETIADALSMKFSRIYGNFLSSIIIKEKDFKNRYLRGDKFIKNIIDGENVISGKYFLELIHG